MKKALLLCVFSITGYWIYAQVTATIMGTTDVTCNGYCDGTATVEGSGGTSPYTYEWDDPGMQTSPTATGLCPGTYNCTVTDAVFSTDVAIVEISEPGMLNSITMGTDPLCFGLCDGEATCTPSGGTPPYTYQWDDPGYQVTGTAINLCPGYYNVTVTDFNGCEYIDGIMINAPSELFISASKNDVTCFGYCDGSIDISVSGGVSGYVYNWSGGQTTQDLSGLCTGNYAVTVTDANGCIIDTALFISSPDEITIDMMEYNTCYGLCTGSLTATVYGGNSPYTYFWSQGGTTMSIYSLCSGAYSLTVTDGIGCVKTANPVVTENPEIGLSLEVNDISCAYYSDGSIDLTVTSGASPFSYSWSNSAYDEDIYGLGPGWYFVTVYDNNGCTKTDSAEITEPSQLWSSLFNSDPTCFGGNDGALDLTPYDGTPPYTYYWSNGLTTEDISGLTAGYYDVTVTDANGCYAYDGTELFDPPQTMLMPVSQNTTCGSNDGWASVDIGNGTPPYDYLWSNASSEDTITGIPAGIYFVTVTDGNSCTTVTQIIVNDNGGPYIYENYILDVTCNGFCNGEISMFASASAPPYSYLWSNAATDSTISGLCPGEYTLTVTDGLGCKGFEMRIISEPAELYTSSEGNDPQCPGYYDGYAWTSPVGGTTPYNYQWDDITMSTESYIPGLEAGTYHVTVTDINGCEVTDSVFLTEPSEIITSVVKTDAACFGDNSGTANLTVSGGTPPYSFNWSNAVYDEDNYNLYAGWYYVTVNDGNGCSKVDSVEIMEPSQIIASTVGTDPTCYMGDDGSIDLTVSGGVSPYFYLWNEGATDEDLTGAVAAEYSVTITDDKGCTAMTADSLNDPAPMYFMTNVTDASCGNSDGEASLSYMNGGTSPFTYLWSNAETNDLIFGLYAGHYTVTVTDVNGCTWTDYADINDSGGPIVYIDIVTHPDCYNDCNGAISISVSGGSPPYSYNWSNSAITQNINGLCDGEYTVTVTDNALCVGIVTDYVIEPDSITADVSILTPECYGENNGYAELAGIFGGTSPYTYLWSCGSTNSWADSLTAGSYQVTIYDYNGCTNVIPVTVSDPPQLIVDSVQSNDVSCYGMNNGSIVVFASSGIPPFEFSINDGSSYQYGNMFSNLNPGSYTIKVKDANYCVTTGPTVTISEPGELSASMIGTNASCYGANDGTAEAIPSGGVSPYSFTWQTAQTEQYINGLTAGEYSVTITDNNGCTAVNQISVNEPDELVVTGFTTNVLCNGETDGAIDITVTGGTSPFMYDWSGGQTTEDISGMPAGSYNVTLTDNNSCTKTANFSITQPPVLTASITGTTDVLCQSSCDGSANSSVGGGASPYSYLWNDPSVQTTPTATALCAGSYTVTITDSNGCTSTAGATITQPSALIADAGADQQICTGSNAVIGGSPTASGGTSPYTYNWNNSGYLNSSTIANPTTSLTGSMTFTVSVTDANGCLATDYVMVTLNSHPVADAGSDKQICEGQSVAIGGSPTASGGAGPYTYAWDNAGSLDNSTIANPTSSATSSTTYSVTVTDANGCTSTDNITITVNSAPTATATNNGPVCEGDALNLTCGPGSMASYLWSGPLGFGSTQQSPVVSASATTAMAGTYTITVTDANGCTDTETTTVTVYSSPTATTGSNSPVCVGETLTLTGGPGAMASYTWSGPDSYSGSSQSPTVSTSATSAMTGTYSLTVTDANGCTAVDNVNVTVNPVPTNITSSTDVNCNGGNDGTASVVASGGTSPYTYNWDIGATTQTATGLTVGTYIVTVTDANGCTAVDDAVVNQPSALTASISGSANVLCFGGNDGTATVAASGGTTPYTYNWNNGATTASVISLAANTYTVTVTDANGCTATADAVISEPPLMNVLFDIYGDVTCNGACDGFANLVLTGGTPPTTLDPIPFSVGMNDALCAGTYSITVTDANGCTAVSNTIIIGEPAILLLTPAVTNATCGNPDGSASIVASGGTTPYSYDWSPNGYTGDYTDYYSNLPAGAYSVTVTDANGCTANTVVNVNDSGAPSAMITGSTNATCNGQCNGNATVSASGGTTPYTFLWDDPGVQTTLTASGLCAGSYNVTVTDFIGCIATASVSISQPTILNASITTSTNVTCSGECDGSATVSVSGGTTPYSYEWDVAQTDATANGLCANTHSVTVTDANLCTASTSVVISEPPVLTITLDSATDVSCNGGNDGAVNITVTGGTTPYSVLWSSGATTEDISGLIADIYTVTVTDANGCTSSTGATISEPSVMTLSPVLTDATCNNSCDGTVDIFVSGGTSPYTYSWSSGQTTHDLSGLCAGSYIVTVTDINGCTATDTVGIFQPDPISFSPFTSEINCNGDCNGSIDLMAVTGGNGGYAYLWSPGGMTDVYITGLCAGAYDITVTDVLGCTKDSSITLTQPDLLIIPYSVTDVTCAGGNDGSIEGAPTGGTPPYTYIWSNSDTNEDIYGLTADTYTVTVTDANGCTVNDTAVINENPALSVIISGADVTCNGSSNGEVSAAPSGGTGTYTYQWDDPVFSTSQTVTGLAAGTYSVTVTDGNGCTVTDSYSITEPGAIILTPSASDATCGGSDGSASVVAGGGITPYTYDWSPDGYTGDYTDSYTGLPAGAYSVTVTDANGCYTTTVANVNDAGAPTANISGSTDATCFGSCDGDATVSAGGGAPPYTYLWDDPGSQTTTTASGLCAGSYNVSVTDFNGCIASASVTISEPPVLNASVTGVTDASCNSLCDGTATVSVSGGTGAGTYSYLWDCGQTTETATGLCAGNYTVTVTDGNSCTTTASTPVTEPSVIILTASVTDISCNGLNNGAIDLTVTGGTGGYTFNWSNTSGTEDISGLAEGNYSVTVTDENGCSVYDTFSVTEPAALTASVITTDATCNTDCDGTADLTVGGGTTPYTFNWSSGQTTEDLSAICAGNYDVTITDANICLYFEAAVISQPDAITIVPATTEITCNGICDGAIDLVSVTGGNGSYSYLWSPGGMTDALVNGLCAGTYDVTVTDVLGCTGTGSYTLTEPPAVSLSASVTGISCNGLSDGAIDITVSGGSGGYSFDWSNGATTEDLTGIPQGTYSVTVSDANGCSVEDAYTLSQPSTLIVNEIITDVTCMGYSDGAIDLNTTGGTPPYSYLWDTGASSEDLTGLAAGAYILTLTDANGCTSDSSFTINPGLTITVSVGTDITICENTPEVMLDGTVTGATGGSWTTSGTGIFDNANSLTPIYTASAADIFAGSVTLTLTSTGNGGCTAVTDNVLIIIDAAPTADAGADQASCANIASVSLSGSVLNATGGIWSSTGTGTFTNNTSLTTEYMPSAGDYAAGSAKIVLTTTGSATCTEVSDTMLVTFDPAPVADAGMDISVCANNADVVLAGLISNASGGSWSGGAGTFNPDNTTLNAVYTPSAGEISSGSVALTLTSTGNGNCTAEYDNLLITVTPAPVINAGPDAAICADTDVVVLSGTVTGATGAEWTSSGSGSFDNAASLITNYIPSPADISAGSVTLTLTSTGNGNCLAVADNMALTIHPAVSMTITSTDAACFNGNDGTATAVVSGGTAPFTYTWSNGSTTENADGLYAGLYYVTVGDANGCSVTDTAEIQQPVVLTGTLAATNVTCNGGNDGGIDLTVTGGTTPYVYIWSNSATTEDIFGLTAGAFDVTITDNNGCIKMYSKTITQPSALSATISSMTNVSCNGGNDGEATVSVTGGTSPYAYMWPTGGTSATVTGLTTGTYSVTVTDLNGCTTSTNTLITAPPVLALSVVSSTDVSCNGLSDGSATISASGGTSPYAYLWPDSGSSDTESGLSAGSYSVSVTDDHGCTATGTVTITQPQALSVTITSATNVTCNGGSNGSAIAAGSGGTTPYNYEWTSGGTTNVETGLTAGLFEITVTDAHGCTAMNYAAISEPPALTLSLTPSYVSCFGGNNGSIAAVAGGGSGSYTYSWSTGGTQMMLSNLVAGQYSATVTDADGCTVTGDATVTEPSELVVTMTQTDVSCFGGDDGSVVASINGGTPGYTYNWSTGGITYGQYGLPAGSYNLTVTDQNGCVAIEADIIGQPDALAISSVTTNATCDDHNDGTIDITVSGGTASYTFNWINGSTEEDIDNILPGSYTVTLTDANGCTLSESITVEITYITSLYGIVMDEGTALSEESALVELYSDISLEGGMFHKVATMPIDGNGAYLFNNLYPDSTYYLKAILIDHESYPTLITTYYDTTISYQDATPINILCDQNLNINIEMRNVPEPPPVGGGYISGTITYNEAPDIKAIGDPVPGAEIYIEQEPNDEPVANTTTDSSGFYQFYHIPSGYTYSIYVDIPGLPLITTHSFTVHENDTIHNDLDFVVDTSSVGGGIFMVDGNSVSETEEPEFIVSIYPNPYREQINIGYILTHSGTVNIEVFDMNGRKVAVLAEKVQQQGEYTYTFNSDMYGINSGTYFIKINIDDHTIIKKIVGIE